MNKEIKDGCGNSMMISSLIKSLNNEDKYNINKEDKDKKQILNLLSCINCGVLSISKPITCFNCFRIFCESCIDKNVYCCGSKNIQKLLHPFQKRMLNALNISCSFCCTNIDSFKLSSWSYLYKCVACKGNISEHILEKHILECSETFTTCKICKKKVFSQLIPGHKCVQTCYICIETVNGEHSQLDCDIIKRLKNQFSEEKNLLQMKIEELSRSRPFEPRADAFPDEKKNISTNQSNPRINRFQSNSESGKGGRSQSVHVKQKNDTRNLFYESISFKYPVETALEKIQSPLEELTNINTIGGVHLAKMGSLLIKFVNATSILQVKLRFYHKYISKNADLRNVVLAFAIQNNQEIPLDCSTSILKKDDYSELLFSSKICANSLKIENVYPSAICLSYLQVNNFDPYKIQEVSHSTNKSRLIQSYKVSSFYSSKFGRSDFSSLNNTPSSDESVSKEGVCLGKNEIIIFAFARHQDFDRIIIKPFCLNSDDWKPYYGRGSKVEVSSDESENFREVGIIPQTYGFETLTSVELLFCHKAKYIRITSTSNEPFGISFIKVPQIREFYSNSNIFCPNFSSSGELIINNKLKNINSIAEFNISVSPPGYLLLELFEKKWISSIDLIPSAVYELQFIMKIDLCISLNGTEWISFDKSGSTQNGYMYKGKVPIEAKFIRFKSEETFSLKNLIINT